MISAAGVRHLLWIIGLLFGVVPLFAQVGTDAPPAEVDRPLPIQPRSPRSETDEDKLAAASLFAHGRVLLQRGEHAAALRRYQRAWRYDPQNGTVLAEIVPLAFELNRDEEATRYALYAVEVNPLDSVLVRRLAIHLAKDKQPKRAAEMFEKALKLGGDKGGPPNDLPTALLLVELGRLHFLGGDYVRSAVAFSRVRDAIADPSKPLGEEGTKTVLGEDGETYAMMGEAFLKAKRPDEAAVAFQKANEVAGEPSQLAFRLAQVDAERGKVDAALNHLNDYFQAKEPTAGRPPFELLKSLLAKKHTDPAAARGALAAKLRAILERDPDQTEAALSLAETLFEEKKWNEAAPLLKKVLDKTPSGEVYGRLLEAYAGLGDAPAVLGILTDVVQKVGGLDVINEQLTETAKQREIVAKVIQTARSARDAQPPEVIPGRLFAAGMFALIGGQFDAADDLLASAAKEGKESKPAKPQVLLQWATAMLMADQGARAATVFKRMIDERAMPANEAVIHYYLAGALEIAGKTDEALAAVDRAIKKNPTPRFESRKGWILYHAKRLAEADAAYAAVIAKYDDIHQTEVREALRQARLIRSNARLQQDDFPAAVELLEQVLDEFPDDPGALNDLSYLWSERGLHLNRALQMAQKAVAAEPENKAYRDSLGWAFYQLGKYEAAAAEIERAVNDEEPGGVVLEHWGDVSAKLGRLDQAKTAWKRAVEALAKEGDAKRAELVRAKTTSAGS